MTRARTLAACLASIEAELQPFRARNGSHQRRGTGPAPYPRRPAPQPFGRKRPDSRDQAPLSWHAATGLGISAFALLYMAQVLLEALTR